MTSTLSPQNLFNIARQVPLQTLAWPALNDIGINVIVRRDDLVHAQLSGNKFYKLFFNLQAAIAQGHDTVLSFGGAYSNHIHALAAAGKIHGLKTIGIIRGEQANAESLSPTLIDARHWDMRLQFVDRTTYRNKKTAEVINQLHDQYGDFYTVPEGGANLLGAKGCQTISTATQQALEGNYDAICVACGTGGTLAGIASALPLGKMAYGFSVLKGSGSLNDEINKLVQQLTIGTQHNNQQNWQLISGYHGGGYAKLKPELLEFMTTFEATTGLQLDPVYTAKLFWGIAQHAKQGAWPRGTRLVIVHSGGLQGRRGYSTLLTHCTPPAQSNPN